MYGGFQPTAFQPNAFQNTNTVPSQYGYCILSCRSQGRKTFLSGGALLATGYYFDVNRVAFTPTAVAYRVDDLTCGTADNIVPWTALTPAVSNSILITSGNNPMISFSRRIERHQLLLRIMDAFGNVFYAQTQYKVQLGPKPITFNEQ